MELRLHQHMYVMEIKKRQKEKGPSNSLPGSSKHFHSIYNYFLNLLREEKLSSQGLRKISDVGWRWIGIFFH
jgi:hypothetical protein